MQKIFSEYLLAIKVKKIIQILMSKPVYLGLSILESSKILMHDVWNDHLKPKYDEKVKLFYTVRVVSLYK